MADWYDQNASKQTSLDPRADYERKLRERQMAEEQAASPQGQAQEAAAGSGAEAGSNAVSNKMATQKTADALASQKVGESGSGFSTAGDATLAVGASTGNPYLVAAGAALKVVGAADQAKRNAQEKQRVAYNERIAQRQQAMQMIASQGIQ